MRKDIMQSARMMFFLLVLTIFCTSATNHSSKKDIVPIPVRHFNSQPLSIYTKLHLKDLGLTENAYNLALKGWERLKVSGQVSKDILTICDFTQSSNKERLYIIDMHNGTLLFNTLVAHGKNTGEEYARYFSNTPSSLQSSLGFYVTGNTCYGKHGLSLVLQGKEPGFNDKAREREIIMHGADYVSEQFVCKYGRLGKSWGCPAVPYGVHSQIINTIKEGSCLFIYYPDKNYLAKSKLLNNPVS